MKKLHVFSYRDRAQAALIQEILTNEGIHCLLRNDQLSSALGEIPFVECYPELWVVDDEVYPRAQTFLNGWLRDSSCTNEPWYCLVCGEQSEGHFGACWACGTLRNEQNHDSQENRRK